MLARGHPLELDRPGQFNQLVDGPFDRMARAARGSLPHQGRDRHLPSLVDLADQVFLGPADVVIEDFVETGLAGYLPERAHRDAGAFHIDQQIGDALMLGSGGVGAHQQHLHAGALREAGPQLLPVHHEGVAFEHGAGLQARKVGARAGLGVALAPDLFAGQHLAEVAFFLLLGAEQNDGGPDAVDRELVGAVERQAKAQDFVLVNRLFDERGAAAAPFLRPVQRDVARVIEPLVILAQALPFGVVADVEQAGGRSAHRVPAPSEQFARGFLEPRAQARTKRLLLRSETEIHTRSPLRNLTLAAVNYSNGPAPGLTGQPCAPAPCQGARGRFARDGGRLLYDWRLTAPANALCGGGRRAKLSSTRRVAKADGVQDDQDSEQ